jgi:predicted DNA-binding transcriptional regulator AlpA
MRHTRTSLPPHLEDMADDRVLKLSEFAEIAGISVITLRRRIAAEEGPIVTRLSLRRIGIRVRDGRAWLDARARSNAAALHTTPERSWLN